MRIKKKKHINILIAGGSGTWCEKNHYPSILKLKKSGINVKVIAIVDPIDPYNKFTNNNFLSKILKIDSPIWIDTLKYSSKELTKLLNKLHNTRNIDIIVITSNPAEHYFYNKWAVNNKVNVLCDKPPIIFKNAAFDNSKARMIIVEYYKLLKLVYRIKKKKRNYNFCLALRRRALKPFLYMADSIKRIYEKTGQGITHMNIIINNGIHRYPQEFLKGGAHGYLDGIGALSHSNYHYIDTVAWFISICNNWANKIEITVPYIFRVQDYLQNKGYKRLQNLIEKKSVIIDNNVVLPQEILNSELDFIAHFKLFDKMNRIVGLVVYQSNHTSYSPRLVCFDPKVIDPANIHGRMSHVYYDIHQGAFQNIQLVKNDVVFENYSIRIVKREHPKIGIQQEEKVYDNPYNEGTITTQDLFMAFVRKCAGLDYDRKIIRFLSTLKSQKLTIEIFGKLYEAISREE